MSNNAPAAIDNTTDTLIQAEARKYRTTARPAATNGLRFWDFAATVWNAETRHAPRVRTTPITMTWVATWGGAKVAATQPIVALTKSEARMALCRLLGLKRLPRGMRLTKV